MELSNLHKIAIVNSSSLNIEEISGIEVAMLQRKLQENLVGKPTFSGKIYGSTQDYLIVQHVDPYAEFPDKKFYYW